MAAVVILRSTPNTGVDAAPAMTSQFSLSRIGAGTSELQNAGLLTPMLDAQIKKAVASLQ
jgi:hypothetical protein